MKYFYLFFYLQAQMLPNANSEKLEVYQDSMVGCLCLHSWTESTLLACLLWKIFCHCNDNWDLNPCWFLVSLDRASETTGKSALTSKILTLFMARIFREILFLLYM